MTTKMGSQEVQLKSYEDFCKEATKECIAEHFDTAHDLYIKALECNSSGIDALIGLSNVSIKQEKFAKAQDYADKAIDVARKMPSTETQTLCASAFLKGGLACFHRGEYRRAKDYFQEGLKYDSSPKTGLNQWVHWCDEKMEKCAAKSKDGAQAALAQELSQAHIDPPKPPVQEAKIKHDWYQTETTVVVEIRLKGSKKDQVKVDMTAKELSVSAPIPGRQSEYCLNIDLAHEIQPEKSTFNVMSTKIEIKLMKKDGIRWNVLEGEDNFPSSFTPAPSAASGSDNPKPPSHPGKKDWSKIEKDLEKELEDEKPEGEAALNDLFAKIYRDGDDNLRRAMNKSFQESGGTVLSTNWDEIKQGKTDVKPPDGMEFKKWD